MRRDPWARRLSDAEKDGASLAAAAARDALPLKDQAMLAETIAYLLGDLWLLDGPDEDRSQRLLEHLINRVTELAQEHTALLLTRDALARAAKR
jgi:hypothetical protein